MAQVGVRNKWLKNYGQSIECRHDFHKHLREMFNKQSSAELSHATDLTDTSSCLTLSTSFPKQANSPNLLTFDPVANSVVLFNLQSRTIQDRIEIEDIDLPQGFQCVNVPRKGVLISGGRRLASNLESCFLLSFKESYEVNDLFA